MDKVEANKIIAEYMDLEVNDVGCPLKEEAISTLEGGVRYETLQLTPYYESLDALVPVWEKLKVFNPEITVQGISCSTKGTIIQWECTDAYSPYEIRQILTSRSTSICEAVAISTAKTIKAVNNG